MGRPGGRIKPVEVVALVVLAVGVAGVVASLLIPLSQNVTFTGTALFHPRQTTATITVQCGSPMQSGPLGVGVTDRFRNSDDGYRSHPCRGAITTRRVIIGGFGVVTLGAAAVVVVSERRRRRDLRQTQDR